MNKLTWKENLRRSGELAEQGKARIEFNANFYNALLPRQNGNQQAVVAFQPKTKAVGKEISI